jgi:dTDP-4-dehydrorhamnose 3,5-epimerase
MKFIETTLKGAFVIDLEKHEDERGFFARAWCQKEFEAHGIYRLPVQTNMSYNKKAGTIRGMHYQAAPNQESKLIRCINGAVYDVIIDLRKDSPTYKQWVGIELNTENRKMVFVPEDFAHGFLALKDHSEVMYQVSAFYNFESERIIRYDDPSFDIKWPIEVTVVSEKDITTPNFKE